MFPTPLGNIGIVVCFDRHYPESIRTESLRGADLILVPTANTKAEPMEMFEWEIRVQAFQNCVPIVMCNRTGLEGAMDFAGESIAVDANGALLAKADDKEQLLYAEIDLAQTARTKAKRPYLFCGARKLTNKTNYSKALPSNLSVGGAFFVCYQKQIDCIRKYREG